MTANKENLTAAGGKYWESPDGTKKRVYFSPKLVCELIGLDVEYYNTGNVSSARLRGEKISNGQARSILCEIDTSKHFYDMIEEKWVSGYSAVAIKKAVHEKIEKIEKNKKPEEGKP